MRSARRLAVAALAVVGCGCGSSQETTSTPRPASAPRPAATTPAPTARPRRTAPAAPASPRARAQARRYDRAFNALPYRAGPLPVEQTIESQEQPDLLVARLAPSRFFCLGSPARRAAAVRAYYRRARARVRARGLADLRLVVAPVGPTAEVTGAWARAHRGRVTLTPAGRQGRCARK